MKVAIKPPVNRRLVVDRPSFVMVGMMRSGSNFLERQLNLLPSVRCHGELFNPHFIGFAANYGGRFLGYQRNDMAQRNADPVGFMNQVLAASDRQQCGLRMFLDHDPKVMSEVLYHPGVRKVVLTRNLLDAYVSLQIARETDVWLTTAEPPSEAPHRVHVEAADLVQFALRQSMFYNDVLTLLHRSGQPYFHIDYSEIKDLARLNALTEFLGVPDRLQAVEEPIQRQNPGEQRDKIANYPQLVEALRKRSMARWFI